LLICSKLNNGEDGGLETWIEDGIFCVNWFYVKLNYKY
jgi:hypothetical protein